MRDEPLLLVLDEPTAALDAETEHALFERYAGGARIARSATAGRITILVSHRFSHRCGWPTSIVVLDGARVVEVGSARRADGDAAASTPELYGIQAGAAKAVSPAYDRVPTGVE